MNVDSSISIASNTLADIMTLATTICTSISPVNLGPAEVLENRGNVYDVTYFRHGRAHILLVIQSDCVVLHLAITSGKNTLHVRTVVGHSETWLFHTPDQPWFQRAQLRRSKG